MEKVLLISPNKPWISAAEEHVLSQGYLCERAITGREAQLKAYKSQPHYIFLDMAITEHSGIEVFKYLKNTLHDCKIFITIPSSSTDWNEEELLRMGATKVIRDANPKFVIKYIKSLGRIIKWTEEDEKTDETPLDQEVDITDENFTRMLLTDFFEDVVTPADLYIRIGANKYIKIVHEGDRTTSTQFKKYADSGAQHIFFRTKDRFKFVSAQNEIAKRAIQTEKHSNSTVVKASKTAHEKLMEEISASGVQPELLEEGRTICRNIYESAKRDRTLRTLLSNLEEFNPALFSESFMVSFFSTVICRNLDWVGLKTIDSLALGGLLHDIGLVQLPPHLVDLDKTLMSPEDRALYERHPELGATAVKDIRGITPAVIDIILQHHEHMDMTGFPRKISGHKIFPLAKIIHLADGFTSFVKARGEPPMVCIKEFAIAPETQVQYDVQLVKNLIKGMIN